tara:strand:- start:111 stop:509 length:399 start_codon:yes stop_codon:yes gene_type:complete
MSSAGAVGSGGSGGAAAAPASSQRATPADGGAAVGSENNKGVEMGGTPEAGGDSGSTNINITNEVNCFQNMSSEQSISIGGGSEMGQSGESGQIDLEKLMKMIMMMIMMKMMEKMMEQMGGGAEGGASMMGG